MKFELDPDEGKRYDIWYANHLKEEHGGEVPYSGAIGGGVTFRITPTGIGNLLGVECNHCTHNLRLSAFEKALHDDEARKRSGTTLTNYDEL